MSRLRQSYLIRGLGLESLLNQAQKKGIPLYDICREGRSMRFSVPYAQHAEFEALCQALGFSPEKLPAQGGLKRLQQLSKRRSLLCLSIVSLAVLWGLLQFIWRIEVTGAGIYTGEINRYLLENHIQTGIFKRSLQTEKICNDLMYLLPKLTWVRTSVQGTTLRIEATQGTSLAGTAVGLQTGDLVASQDGIIAKIDVFSGTACVKRGDTVRKGDVLIRGEEAGIYHESKAAVHAAGRVMARVWKQESADISMRAMESHETGRTVTAVNIATPWKVLHRAEEPSYLTYDRDISVLPIVGVWVPIWEETITYQEVSLEPVLRDSEEAKAEAGLLAMEKLVTSCNKSDEIIDKRLNFSMIEGDTIHATATAELIADIGLFVPQTSD